MPSDKTSNPVIPLARWADRQLRLLADETRSNAIASLRGETLLGERAALNGFTVPARRSAGRKCHLLAAKGGWFALNLARDADRDLLPALFETRMLDTRDLGEIAELVFDRDLAQLVARGREMGLAVAGSNEAPAAPAHATITRATPCERPDRAPLVLDLSALWAGPLCSHLLQQAGAQVIKIESATRPDAMRSGDPEFFALLNQAKDNVALDLRSSDGRDALIGLIAKADIVIEAARPRALLQLGIDADALVSAKPGLTWITITGHGAQGEPANWIGFGDDCGVAGGLTHALEQATGASGFVGDAIADPLTGITAARCAWAAHSSGQGGRIGLSMSAIVAQALADERAHAPGDLETDLAHWASIAGKPCPAVERHAIQSAPRALGADNARWLAC